MPPTTRPTVATDTQSAAPTRANGAASRPFATTLNTSPRVVAQRALAAQLNRGGMPANLRAGVERLSGVSMAGVKVHYNSAKPAQLNAEAYAQGRDIHLAPGKAHHLPHEAWHVVQQAQGRVRPTMQLREAVPINDDKRLEKEADEMGKKATTLGSVAQRAVPKNANLPKPAASAGTYLAIGGEKAAFDPAKHPRRQFDFGSKTRSEVLKQHVRVEAADGTVESVRVVTGTHENVGGVQLDHIYSWANIAKNMNGRNKAVAAKTAGNSTDWYSLWDAKMYYNDQTNLQPVLGSANASAGAGGVKAAPKIKDKFALEIANIHSNFMWLQRATNKVGKKPGAVKEAAIDKQLLDAKTAVTKSATAVDAL